MLLHVVYSFILEEYVTSPPKWYHRKRVTVRLVSGMNGSRVLPTQDA